jgi:autotransporter-associated beta strand protein
MAWAQTQNWAGATATWETFANWGGSYPDSVTVRAQFGATGDTTPTISTFINVGAVTFQAGAQPYTLNVAAGGLTFNATGIVNNSGVTQTLSSTVVGAFTFLNSATSANATFDLSGGTIAYQNSSTAGTSTINVSTASGLVTVQDSASLSSATVNLSTGAQLVISGSGSGGTATVTMANTNNSVDISGTTAGTSIGSIAGSGSVVLGSQQLTVGGNNATTSLSGVISGTGGSIVKTGTGTWTLTGANTYGGGTTVNAGILQLGAGGSLLATGALTVNGGTFDLNGISQAVGALSGAGGTIALGIATLTANSASSTTLAAAITGTGALVKQGTGTLILTGANNYGGGTTVSGGTLQGTTTSLQGNILNNANVTFNQGTTGTYAGIMSGTGSLTVNGTGTVILGAVNTYGGGTTVSGGLVNFSNLGNFGSGNITLNGGGLQWASGNTTDISGRLNALGAGGSTFDTNGNNVTLASAITGTGGLTKVGLGTLTLSGANTYTGGTIINAGTLLLASGVSLPTVGMVTINGGTLNIGSNNLSLSAINALSGSIAMGGGTLTYNSAGVASLALPITGNGGLAVQGGGTLFLTGASTFTGTTAVTGSTLVVNGSLASTVTLDGTSTIGGNGTIGSLVSNGGTISPGNSIGTLTVNGSFAQTGGTYVVEANSQGQSDRVTVNGAATINGGTVQVAAASGIYANSTTYTILSATGGVSGTYSVVSSNFAFLTPSLSYGANGVLLTLALQGNAFSGFGGNTPNQRAVGSALDQSYANATGDFATVIGALAGLSTQQAGPALTAISGQPIANFGTGNVAGNVMFMNTLGQQMAVARGTPGGGQRQALAQACEIEACDGTSPFSVWGSAVGGLGSVQGNGNASTFTYNLGGAAAGIDYRLDPRFLVGLGTGYTAGTQWVDSFQGKAWSNSVSVAAYGSFTDANVYVDALAGYAYSNNQLQQYIVIPGLQPRQANGSTGANAFLGQVEAGYRIGVYAPAAATVTPFARFQASSINQAGFTEWGANSLNLTVAQQMTTSLRTTVGADLAGTIGPMLLGLRLGWLHEYADTSRPMTAAFAGAPAAGFTVYGATPQRDSAVIGFQAGARVADSTSIYLRYDGEIASGSDNHTLNLGLRLSW